MRRTERRLADGRRIVYYDEHGGPERTASDTRELAGVRPESERRLDPLTGEWVTFAAYRQGRTYHPPVELCPLCPSGSGRSTEIPETWYDVVVFENRFPSYAGRCEVVCFTSEHDSSFGALPPSRVRTVLDVLADRTTELSALPGVAQVFPFENRGAEIGVTLAHPHGQVYGYPFVPPRAARLLELSAELGRPVVGDLLAAELADGRRIVARGAHWTAYVPAAARWPVEVHLVPHRQVADLPSLTTAERDDFGPVYLDVLRRLDRRYDRPLPYVAAWHQAPVRAPRDLAWLYLQVFSVRRGADRLKYLAGSESGMGAWINDLLPEDIARALAAVSP